MDCQATQVSSAPHAASPDLEKFNLSATHPQSSKNSRKQDKLSKRPCAQPLPRENGVGLPYILEFNPYAQDWKG